MRVYGYRDGRDDGDHFGDGGDDCYEDEDTRGFWDQRKPRRTMGFH